MIDTSTEQLIPLNQLSAAAIPGMESKPVPPRTVRNWCSSGVRGIRLESVKIGGMRCTSTAALNRFFQAVTAAANDGRKPKGMNSRPRREQASAV